MARTIYEKPARALLKDMLKDLGLKPDRVFRTGGAMHQLSVTVNRVALMGL